MATVEQPQTQTKRFTDADKIRTVSWLATRPKPIEAESMAGAADAISKELNVKLAPAVLQGILEADQSLAAKLVIGGGGQYSQLRDVVEALSIRVDALGKLNDDLSIRINELEQSNNLLRQSVEQLEATSTKHSAWMLRQTDQPIGAKPDANVLPGLEDYEHGPGADPSPA